MKRPRLVTLLVVVALAVAGLVFHRRLIAWFSGEHPGAAGTAVATPAGTWQVTTALDPDPPREHGQRARVTVLDAGGAPAHGANVEITYDMPAMGAMAEMKASFPAEQTGHGVFEATFDLPMGGSWGLWVKIREGGACTIARYKFTVGQTGLAADGVDGCAASADRTIQIDEARRQAVGITTGKVTRGPMTLDIRAVGRVTYDETRLTDVVLKVGGFVSDLRVRATGQTVTKGQPMFLLYSPELFAAEQDYLVARSSQGLIGSGAGDGLVRAAETKLTLLGLSRAQLQQIARNNAPIEKLLFTAPASGSVIEKTVVEGDAIQAGQRLFRIAALDTIWVEAELFEADLPHVVVGTPAEIALRAGATFTGKVTFVYPYLDLQTRTGRVRIELPNPGLALKPQMYATVTFAVPLPDQLQVPTSAILYAGPRRVVFVDRGGGTLEPRDVTLGAHSGERTAVLSGLAEGDTVVTSGNFLVSSEARLRGIQ